MIEGIGPSSLFFETAYEDEQAALVQIPKGFEFVSTSTHAEGVVTDGQGNVIYDARDSGTILRVRIRREEGTND